MRYFNRLMFLRDKVVDGRATIKSIAKEMREYVSLFETQADLAQELNEYIDTYYEYSIGYSLMVHLTFAALTLPEAEHKLNLANDTYERVDGVITFPKLADAFRGTTTSKPSIFETIKETEYQYKGDK
nr:MAG TPA: hypothetical protein [Caudoviricetes sp.]